jgi:hypothetical protein
MAMPVTFFQGSIRLKQQTVSCCLLAALGARLPACMPRVEVEAETIANLL